MWFRRPRCSFCRRSDQQVAKLVAGARGYICDTCAYETIRIMESSTPPPGRHVARQPTAPLKRASERNRAWHFATTND